MKKAIRLGTILAFVAIIWGNYHKTTDKNLMIPEGNLYDEKKIEIPKDLYIKKDSTPYKGNDIEVDVQQ